MIRDPVLLAWSSGKDSAFALHVLREMEDVEVVGLLTTVNERHDRVAMHAVRRTLLEAQAEAAGIPLTIVRIPDPCPDVAYEAAMGRALETARARGIRGVAFGDLFLEDIRRYREAQMAGTGLRLVFPLWGRPTAALAHAMLGAGLRARITCVDPRVLSASFAGREFDRQLLDLPPAVDPCGENGEFHTFAWDGPMFDHPVPVREGLVVERDGFVFADLLPVGRCGLEGFRAGNDVTRLLISVMAGLLGLAPSLSAAQGTAPRRVASMNLSADEILAEILPPERLVGVTRFADEQGTSNIVGRIPPSVFRFQKADMERLVALAPDLVVVSEYTDADFLKLVEHSGMRWHRMEGLNSIAGVRRAIVDLGRVVGVEEGARRLAERYDATLAELSRRLSGSPTPRVLYWSGEMTAGADTSIGALLECAGARNVGREMGVSGVTPPGAERAFVADPDVILVSSWPGTAEAVTAHPLLSRLRAVRDGRVVVMPNELLIALSQYTADACWDLASRLHPDRVPARRP